MPCYTICHEVINAVIQVYYMTNHILLCHISVMGKNTADIISSSSLYDPAALIAEQPRKKKQRKNKKKTYSSKLPQGIVML